jgi:hypothetical protein
MVDGNQTELLGTSFGQPNVAQRPKAKSRDLNGVTIQKVLKPLGLAITLKIRPRIHLPR